MLYFLLLFGTPLYFLGLYLSRTDHRPVRDNKKLQKLLLSVSHMIFFSLDFSRGSVRFDIALSSWIVNHGKNRWVNSQIPLYFASSGDMRHTLAIDLLSHADLSRLSSAGATQCKDNTCWHASQGRSTDSTPYAVPLPSLINYYFPRTDH